MSELFKREDIYNETVGKKKSIKFFLNSKAHQKLKVLCARHNISMSDLFNELTYRILREDDPYLVSVINYVRTGKTTERKKHFSEDDIDLIYRKLENDSVLD